MRVVFMGTPSFAVPVLQRLLSSSYEVVAAYTRRDKPAGRGRQPAASPVKELAAERGLPIYQPISLRRPEEQERLRALSPDLIVVAAYGLILPPEVLDAPPRGALNVHPSLLPRHRGPAPIAGAILAGDPVTGVTIMLMDPGVDTGAILAQRQTPVSAEETTGTLTARLAEEGADLLLEVLPRWLAGEIAPRVQDETRATYTHLFRKEEGEIDWTQPAEEIARSVRAFQPWPGCYTYWSGKRLLVLAASAQPGPPRGEPGEVLRSVEGGRAPASALLVQTGEGTLLLDRVQQEGRRAVTGEEFRRGHSSLTGERLG